MNYHEMQIRPVRSKDMVSFRCTRCGNCCRHIKESVMLESPDAYRIANHLRNTGTPIQSIDDVFLAYAEPVPLTDNGYPAFVLRTVGSDDSCIFLKNGKCSIYDARPRTCRMYPFTVFPGSRGKDFDYFLCTDKPFHLAGGNTSVKDWLYSNFKQDDKEFLKKEKDYTLQVGRLMRQISPLEQTRLTFLLLFYLYYNYQLDAPFLPQYTRNLEQLLQQLKQMATAGEKDS